MDSTPFENAALAPRICPGEGEPRPQIHRPRLRWLARVPQPTPQRVEIRGDVALVTGAAVGIGRAIATRLAAEGAAVVVGTTLVDGGAVLLGTALDVGATTELLLAGTVDESVTTGATGAEAVPSLDDDTATDEASDAVALVRIGCSVATISFSNSSICALISAKVSPSRWSANRAILRHKATSCVNTSPLGIVGTVSTS